MHLIPDNTDLSAYMEAPPFAAKVRSAAEYANDVKLKLRPQHQRVASPSMLLGKARDTIEFRPGEVTAWVGYNGHRKSMFTSQVMLDMAVQEQRVLIVSLEMDPSDTMERMTRQAVGGAHPSDSMVDDFHRWTDGKLWLFDHVGQLSVDHSLGLCRYFSEVLQGTHVVLDSMMMICTSEEKMDEQKRFATGLCRLAQETGLHVHIITHCRKPNGEKGEEKLPTRYDIRGSGAISDQAHNVMVVWMNKRKYEKLEHNPNDIEARAEPCAVVKCDKQRKGSWEGKIALWHDGPSLRFCGDRTSPILPYSLFNDLHVLEEDRT